MTTFSHLPFRFNLRRSVRIATASLSAVNSPSTSFSDSQKSLLLEVKDLTAVIAETKQEILKGVNLVVYEGEVGSKLIFSIVLGVDSHKVLNFSLIFCSFGIIFSDPSRFTPSWARMVLERAHLQRSVLFVFISLILIKKKRISGVLYSNEL